MVGAALASGISPADFKEILFSKTVQDYWDPKIGLGLLAGKKFLSLMQSIFVSDFAQTHVPLEVGVTELPFFKLKFLHQGNLPQSVLASCAVPFMFPPVKVDRLWYYDGGVLQKSGIPLSDRNERVLNIYLDMNKSIFKKTISKNSTVWGPHHRVIYLPKAPRVNPRNLTTGHSAYDQTLKRAEALLQKNFNENVLII